MTALFGRPRLPASCAHGAALRRADHPSDQAAAVFIHEILGHRLEGHRLNLIRTPLVTLGRVVIAGEMLCFVEGDRGAEK